jgi:hypothetical protein
MKNVVRLGSLLFAMLSAACSGSSEPEGEDPEEHACEHAADMSAATPITATADPGAGPTLEISEEPYLVEFDAGTRGHLTVRGPTDSLLFVGQANAVTGLTFGESGNLLPEAGPVEHCTDLIPEHFDLELEETGDYTLSLTSVAPPLWLVYLSAEGHAHE